MKNKLYRLTVLGIEQTLKMKFFVILNILMLVAIVGFVNFDNAKQLFSKITGNNVDKNIIKVMTIDETGKFTEYIKDKNFKDIEVSEYTENGLKEGKILVEIKKDTADIIKVKVTSNKYIDESKYRNIQSVLNEIRSSMFAEKYGASLNDVDKLNKDVNVDRVVLEMNNTDYVKYEDVLMIIAFIMYMLFIFVAATISSTIGMEKISRTTEYMLTGISEKAYLWYNILQVNILFVIQMILSGVYYVLANIISMIVNVKFLGGSLANISSMSNMSLSFDPIIVKIITLTIVQTILCILILSIIQAIMTSKVNNMTDISNSSMLVIMIVILICFVLPNIIKVSESVGLIMKIISCMPVISIVMLPKLILLHQIGNIGIITAVMFNVITLVILSIFGSRWFKRGLLDSGNSKKTDKRKKDEIYDMNKYKFKEAIFKVSIAMLMYLVVSNVLGLVGMLINSSFAINTNIKTIINIIVWILSILPSYLYLRSSYEEVKSKDKLNTKNAISYILIGTLLVAGVQYLVSYITRQTSGIDVVNLVGADFSSIIGITLFIIQIALLPAIFEELLFRKVMLNMLKKYGNLVSILITSICFGLMHQNFSQGIFAFLIGIVLAFIAIKTKSIIPTIAIHFLNNLAAVMMLIATNLNNNTMVNITNILIIAVLVVSAIVLMFNLLKNRSMYKIEKSDIQIKNVLSNILSQYIVVVTLILYVVITIYVQMVLI